MWIGLCHSPAQNFPVAFLLFLEQNLENLTVFKASQLHPVLCSHSFSSFQPHSFLLLFLFGASISLWQIEKSAPSWWTTWRKDFVPWAWCLFTVHNLGNWTQESCLKYAKPQTNQIWTSGRKGKSMGSDDRKGGNPSSATCQMCNPGSDSI